MENEKYLAALQGKKIPILTLDHNWHTLFAMNRNIPEIETFEKEVNGLLKREAAVRSELKKVKVLKKQLMDEIVMLSEKISVSEDAKLQKELNQKKTLIEDCNEKIDELQDELLELPSEIDKANYNLMLESMAECERRLQDNYVEIKEANDWIASIKEELRKRVIMKQRKEKDCYGLYRYMKQYFGDETFKVFDLKYNPEKFAARKNDDGK